MAKIKIEDYCQENIPNMEFEKPEGAFDKIMQKTKIEPSQGTFSRLVNVVGAKRIFYVLSGSVGLNVILLLLYFNGVQPNTIFSGNKGRVEIQDIPASVKPVEDKSKNLIPIKELQDDKQNLVISKVDHSNNVEEPSSNAESRKEVLLLDNKEEVVDNIEPQIVDSLVEKTTTFTRKDKYKVTTVPEKKLSLYEKILAKQKEDSLKKYKLFVPSDSLTNDKIKKVKGE